MRRTRKGLLWWGGVFFSAGTLGMVTLWFWVQLPKYPYTACFMLALLSWIGGFYLLVLAATLRKPAKHPVIHDIRGQEAEIVWVYSFININMPYGVEMFKLVTIWFHYADGRQQYLRIGHAYLEETMASLQQLLPHATFGHSVEKEQLYRANPELLRRE